MAFTSTRLCRCRVVFSGPFRNASLFYASCVPSGGRYRLQCSSRLLSQSSFLDWTIVTAFCFDFITRLQSVQNAVARLIFRIGRSEHLFTRSPTFTGCASQSASPSIHGTSPSSLQSCFTRVADTTSRRRLRSSVQRRLSSPRSTARSTLYSRQAGVPSYRSPTYVERPSVPRHICTITRRLQTASQDFPLLSFLPGHPDMTYLSLLITIIVFSFLFFWHFPCTLQIIDIFRPR